MPHWIPTELEFKRHHNTSTSQSFFVPTTEPLVSQWTFQPATPGLKSKKCSIGRPGRIILLVLVFLFNLLIPFYLPILLLVLHLSILLLILHPSILLLIFHPSIILLVLHQSIILLVTPSINLSADTPPSILLLVLHPSILLLIFQQLSTPLILKNPPRH